MNFDLLFKDSFDTFKVFEKLDTHQASLSNNNSPKSIWQIVNHLIIWQDVQILKLCGKDSIDINEMDTWTAEKEIASQSMLNETIGKFDIQIGLIKAELTKMSISQYDIEQKIKIIQDLTVHLSFHLGEIVLIMRQNGYYPIPSDMDSFLSEG